MSAVELLSAALLTTGAVFSLLGAVGVVRLPDVYTRLSATSKAATLGVACLLLGGAVRFGDVAVAARAVAAIAFLCLTAPVAAHVLGRAAYRAGCAPWAGTVRDELAAGGGAGSAGREAGAAAAEGHTRP
jgi:multicomponent Na+:H+ antiporter subunit G